MTTQREDQQPVTIQQIRQTIASDLQEPVAGVCQSIFAHLADMRPAQARRLTYYHIARFANMQVSDDLLETALTALTTMRHRPLVRYFVLYDEEDNQELAFSAAEVFQSVDEGFLIHPRTGEEVPDFATQLQVVFCASKELISALSAHGS